tara:strand:+ start:1075 stop:2361 length:1287 start_codon:yes stop_codon:yes gene_type:complete
MTIGHIDDLAKAELEAITRKTVIKARAKLCKKQPGTFTLIGGCNIIISTDYDTYATDGKTIWANPHFVTSCTPKQNKTVLLHEFKHIALHHNTRRGEIHPKLWNIACDYIVNGLIIRSPNYGEEYELPPDHLWHDFYSSKECDWSAERVSRQMIKDGWEPPPDDPDGDGPGPGGDGGDEDDDEATGTGGGCGDILDSPTVEEGEIAVQQEEYELKQRLAEASLIDRSAGIGIGSACTVIKDRIERGSRSSEEIREFLQNNVRSRRSFKRPNKRWLSQGMLIPSYEKKVQELYVAIDSSASVGKEEFEQYRNNLVRWASELSLERIRVAYIDHRIHLNPETGEPWYDINLNAGHGAEAMELDIFGGGGTSFDPIFDYIEEELLPVSALVYFTDGYGQVHSQEPNYPVLWLTSGIAPRFYGSQWGEVIWV